MKALSFTLFLCIQFSLHAQSDSVAAEPVKVRHAEPLYIDLIRDLGARKGEREWNAGWGTQNQKQADAYTGFVEYEFSPLNHLGLEVEVPIRFYHTNMQEGDSGSTLRNRVEGVKLATQYTFYVSGKHQLSMAVGYIHEFRLHSFYTIQARQSLVKGNGFNPFFIIAKRLGPHFHMLVYTGPLWEKDFHEQAIHFTYQLNTSIHYMLPDKHFIGIEVNEEFSGSDYQVVARPQLKIILAPNLAVGFATGIPIHSEEKGISFLARIIYEPRIRK